MLVSIRPLAVTKAKPSWQIKFHHRDHRHPVNNIIPAEQPELTTTTTTNKYIYAKKTTVFGTRAPHKTFYPTHTIFRFTLNNISRASERFERSGARPACVSCFNKRNAVLTTDFVYVPLKNKNQYVNLNYLGK